MVGGDIDLTTNLDFYHDKPDPKDKSRKVELIPWKIPTSYIYDFPDTYQTIINGYVDTYTILSNTSYSTYYTYNDIAIDSTLTTTSNSSYWYGNPQSYVIGYSAWQKADSSLKIIYKDMHDEESKYLPSKKKNPMQSSGTMCWNCMRIHIGNCPNKRKQKSEYNPRRVFRTMRAARDISTPRDGENRILQMLHGKSHEVSRKKRSVPWLEKLNSWMYYDYIKDLHEEQDYSKYLTDRSWLRLGGRS